MAIYLGGKQVNVNLNGIMCRIEHYTKPPVINHLTLVTSDGFILTDANGAYITVKEDS